MWKTYPMNKSVIVKTMSFFKMGNRVLTFSGMDAEWGVNKVKP